LCHEAITPGLAEVTSLRPEHIQILNDLAAQRRELLPESRFEIYDNRENRGTGG
jgi:hypothetical protein